MSSTRRLELVGRPSDDLAIVPKIFTADLDKRWGEVAAAVAHTGTAAPISPQS